MAEVKKITHQSKTIFLADHRGWQGQEVIDNQLHLLEMVKKEGGKTALVLTDMTEVFVTIEVHRKLKEIGEELLKHSRKAAVVGMNTGAKKVLINAFIAVAGKPMRLFDEVETAKNWLVQ